MRQLRAHLFRHLGPLMSPLVGWHPANPNGPCLWAQVACDADKHIVKM